MRLILTIAAVALLVLFHVPRLRKQSSPAS